MMNINKKYLTLKETCEYLNIKPSQLDKCFNDWGLPFVRISPKKRLVRLYDLEEWIWQRDKELKEEENNE